VECWQVAYEIVTRCGGDPGHPGMFGPDHAPAAAAPRKVIFLETPGWATSSPGAKEAIYDAMARIEGVGIEVLSRRSSAAIEAVEREIAEGRGRSMRINAWEWRWPLNTYRNRDASKLSEFSMKRLQDAEGMTLDDYRSLLTERDRVRAMYAELASEADAFISLSATGCAPLGLDSTGDPSPTVHTSYLGVPSISLPVLQDEGLPLGLQVNGFADGDAATFATAAWIMSLYDEKPRGHGHAAGGARAYHHS
jgi:Asp-tRNA(Asn)/Glu-tRNA(Gln) amidotransferase A subunit family amidase